VVALVLVAAVMVVLAVVRRSPPEPDATQNALVPTAAERYGWGTPTRQSDFTGDTTGPDWTANGPWPSQGNGHYVQANVSVRNGSAVITGSPNGDTGHMWDSADATSGRLEVQLRIPPGCECHRPAMSLWSVSEQQKAGEIVFLEVPDGDRQTARFALHHPDSSSTMETRRVDLTAWTTVAVEWTPDHVTGYLNGEQWFHTDKKQDIPTSALRPTIKMDWLGSAAPRESVMQIDWIRYYPV
jgi:hypothetical protein